MKMLRRRVVAAAAWIAAAVTVVFAGSQEKAPQYEVHAVRFAHVSYPVAGGGGGGAPGPPHGDHQTGGVGGVWVMRAPGRIVLLDAGFYREKFIARWKPLDFVTPAEALKRGLGIAPEEVTDIVISHTHWDHADGADLFPRATVWVQKDEYDYYIGARGEVLHTGGADPDDAKMFAALKEAGRVRLVDGDAKEILPGITVYTGGKHTYQSQFVGVRTSSGTVVLASDNAYLYENLEKRLPIAQTLDAEANLEAQRRMLKLAASPALVIPGHDPAVFGRFAKVTDGVVRIAR